MTRRTQLQTFLRKHDETVRPLYAAYTRCFWEMSRSGKPEDVQALVEAKRKYLDVYNSKDDFSRLKAWKEQGVDDLDSLTARQLERLYQDFVPYQMDEAALSEIVRREANIESTFNTFRSDFDGTKVSDNKLRDVLRSETDSERRRQAWEAGKQVGQAVAGELVELVELRNREAQRLGYRDYYQLMLETQELSEGWLLGILDELETASEESFADVKTSLDAQLKNRFQLRGTPNYPWLYSDPFFQELPSAGITETLDAIFKDQDIEDLTRQHFRSLGLEIDDLLLTADLYEREGKSQHAFCLDIDREGDVRVLCNVRSDERWMSTMLHEFGHAVYDKYNDRSLPFSLRQPAHTFTTEAIAMLNGRMTKMPSWLAQFAGVSRKKAEEIGPEVFEGIRASMLIFLRWGLTLVRFERELYRDPRQDLDSLWWTLVERIQKITPPPGRSEPDWASKIHLATAPVYYQNYILGELMASQVLEYIRTSVAQSESFFTPAVGEYVVEHIFRPGARWGWNAMLERATGEALTPQHFLRQFNISESGSGMRR